MLLDDDFGFAKAQREYDNQTPPEDDDDIECTNWDNDINECAMHGCKECEYCNLFDQKYTKQDTEDELEDLIYEERFDKE